MKWILTICAISTLCAAASTPLDSARTLALAGAKSYDAANLTGALKILGTLQSSGRLEFEKAVILWRLELIAFCRGDRTGILDYGKKSLDALQRAESASFDKYQILVYRALAHQIIAKQGLAEGISSGPATGAALKEMMKLQPQGYFTRLIEALLLLESPPFVGGNPAKARENFSLLAKEFPDSLEPRIYYARASFLLKDRISALSLIDPVVNAYPKNLLARKIQNEIIAEK